MATQLSTDLANRIREKTGENVYLCYQCVKCTSGCPLAQHFDLAPNQVMRAAQLGMEDLIYGSKTAWLCASCQTCTTRCPRSIDIARSWTASSAKQPGSRAGPRRRDNKVFLRNGHHRVTVGQSQLKCAGPR
jgi:heterodisulfide reductase subunit C